MSERIQRCGPITDTLYDDGRKARCECVHGNVWPEGDSTVSHGGKACDECVGAWKVAHRDLPAVVVAAFGGAGRMWPTRERVDRVGYTAEESRIIDAEVKRRRVPDQWDRA